MEMNEILDNLLFYENIDRSVKAVGHYLDKDTISITIRLNLQRQSREYNLTLSKKQWLGLRDLLDLLLVDIDTDSNKDGWRLDELR